MDQLVVVLIGGGIVLVSVSIGFFMGLKAARPDEKLISREFDPGSTEEPEGDIFNDALLPPEDKKGIPTL